MSWVRFPSPAPSFPRSCFAARGLRSILHPRQRHAPRGTAWRKPPGEAGPPPMMDSLTPPTACLEPPGVQALELARAAQSGFLVIGIVGAVGAGTSWTARVLG